ncbi:alpha/beta fold hydrolase [Vannielia litorea]|uniref:alpha/beta fold hydrolase n=1 Tax=Vannielia litorea TaxID=1217970 RepID=UPI001BCB32A1|nr:alpha/beta fold hydrolase [Vannielia litorea]MBS8225508.1 alpha/beta fold hydrolase [Vannielia litorea]
MSDARRLTLPDGTALNIRTEGPEGAPWLVFSNSVLTDLSVWDGQASALSDRYRVVRYDQRGHGASDVTGGAMDFTRYGADVVALLDALGIARCTFIGLSMGVPTGLAAFAAAPDRFERFVAVDGVSRSAPGREAFWGERRDTARKKGMEEIATSTAPRWMPGMAEDAPALARLTRMIAATPVEGFAAATHALASYDHSQVVPTLAVPFLGITGEKDGAMPEAVAAQFGSVPGATFTNIPGAGHLPNFQAPDAFNTALTAFLEATAQDNTKETR